MLGPLHKIAPLNYGEPSIVIEARWRPGLKTLERTLDHSEPRGRRRQIDYPEPCGLDYTGFTREKVTIFSITLGRPLIGMSTLSKRSRLPLFASVGQDAAS